MWGDAFARPILAALDEAEKRGTPYQIESLKQITSSGVMWSQEIKQGLLRHQDLVLADVMGSTEGGMGSSVMTREATAGTAKFELNEGVAVITDDDRFVEPGSGEMGKVATSAFVPLGYYKDPEKSAATFREVEGVRYSFPGDYATVEPGWLHYLAGPWQCLHQHRWRKSLPRRSGRGGETSRPGGGLFGRWLARRTVR